MNDLRGKKILIAGLGLSGKAVLNALSDLGADVFVYDNKDIKQSEPEFYKELEVAVIAAYLNGMRVPDEDWDMIILSPGISVDSEFVRTAQARGTKVIGELEFAYELGIETFIAITGTNGKTTTTTLVGEIFKNSGAKTFVAGNIGTPVVSFASQVDDDTIIVAEVSSFQLETVSEFRPKVSAILNLTPDHMDRHKTMDMYGDTKARIFMNQNKDDYLVYNADCPKVSALVENASPNLIPFSRLNELEKGAFIKEGHLVIKNDDGELIDIISTSDLIIPGNHNLENALAASAIAYYGGVEPEIIRKTLRSFSGVEHRLELVSTIKGIRFVNDSKGTNPDASMKAIEAVGKDILLIAGGYDKKSDFHEFIDSFEGRVKVLLLIGATSKTIKYTAEKFGFTDIYMCSDMSEAVRIGYENASKGDTVLLSPASASWDMYENYEKRGEHFKKLVGELK